MYQGTLIFLVKRNTEGLITDICLAMKKRGFAKGKWNGVGGKVGDKLPETVRASACREVGEELNLNINEDQLNKVGELNFTFNDDPVWHSLVHVYIVNEWNGEPTESEEMRPKWFKVEDIPYDDMWEDDRYWIPIMLEDKLISAKFEFQNDKLISNEIEEVSKLEDSTEVFRIDYGV